MKRRSPEGSHRTNQASAATHRRIGIAGACALLPAIVALSYGGCGSDEPPIENLCGWLGDPDNCYREFAEKSAAFCGVVGQGNAPKGAFLARDKLDVCVLSEGGQILFDPPLDLAAFPPASVAFKIIRFDGTTCGAGSFSGEQSFSVSVEPFPPDGGAASGGGAASTDVVPGGTFVSAKAPDREVFDVTCPDGVEKHHFDRLQTTRCPEYAALVPRAELEANPGGVTPIEGFVRFRVFYPPTGEAKLENAQPFVVEYFDCAIPPGPLPCANGVKDGAETDIDCGGQQKEPDGTLSCPRCGEMAKCIEDGDCLSGSCVPNMVGIKECAPGGGMGGAGGAGGGAGGSAGGMGGGGGG